MLLPGLSCATCGDGPPSRATFPLCPPCAEDLGPCPPLCPRCLAACGGKGCLPIDATFESVGAAFLAVGRARSTLARWKHRGGPLLDRRVLDPTRERFERWVRSSAPPTEPVLVPVGHSRERTWALQGGSARRVACWLARATGIALGPTLIPRKTQAQAGLGLADRKLNAVRFHLSDREARGLRGRTVLVIDDFLTTGRTLRAAAAAVTAAQPLAIRAWVLGFRPRHSRAARPAP